MKLCNLVEIEDNNMECVILKVKDNVKLDLIKLGCFDGDEEYIRLTKGEDHTCTIFKKDGTNFDWHWGRGGYTLVSDKTSKKGKMIEECITEDFDIYIGDKLENIKASLNIKSLDDVKNANHFVKLMYFDKTNDNICVHKDNGYYKHFSSIDDAINHFEKLNFGVYKQHEYVSDNGCIVEEYYIEKIKEKECEM